MPGHSDPSYPALPLRDRVAVVTGAGQGIGREIARTLADNGAYVYVLDINKANGITVAEEIGGGFLLADVTSTVSIRAAAAEVRRTHPGTDILVNNAGIVRNTPAETTSDEEWDAVFGVNCGGVFRCCREFGRAMLAAGAGTIVNVASMSGLIANRPQPQAAYNASKAAVIMLTKSLATEWARRGVRVNAIAPGYVETDLTLKGMANREWRRQWLDSTPLGRAAQPAEIAPAVLYLVSDASSFVTGSVLAIDGGYTAW